MKHMGKESKLRSDSLITFLQQTGETGTFPHEGCGAMVAELCDDSIFIARGITKREYFAAVAMNGMLSDPNSATLTSENVAELSVNMAHALINALNK
jgi:hypothetical protein